jgi:hypothetical protein
MSILFLITMPTRLGRDLKTVQTLLNVPDGLKAAFSSVLCVFRASVQRDKAGMRRGPTSGNNGL